MRKRSANLGRIPRPNDKPIVVRCSGQVLSFKPLYDRCETAKTVSLEDVHRWLSSVVIEHNGKTVRVILADGMISFVSPDGIFSLPIAAALEAATPVLGRQQTLMKFNAAA